MSQSSPSPDYAHELALALHVVHAASRLTKSVLREQQQQQHQTTHGHSTTAQPPLILASTKSDATPVTVADFAAQALLIASLHAAFPEDSFLGEENADELRRDEGLREQVWALLQRARQDEGGSKSVDAGKNVGKVMLRFPESREDMMDSIDSGRTDSTGTGRVWVMDPVDGTKTFMVGGQYAVCLCLLVNATQQVAVTGCPNLPFPESLFPPPGTSPSRPVMHESLTDATDNGILVSAIKGKGTFLHRMYRDGRLSEPKPVPHLAQVPIPTKPNSYSTPSGFPQEPQTQDANTPFLLTFAEFPPGTSSSSSHTHHALTARALAHPFPPPAPIHIYSQQLKYIALVLSAAHVHLRVPVSRGRYTHIWDHAGGHLLFEEVGGRIEDLDGRRWDFGTGRRIGGVGGVNWGMVAAREGEVFEGVFMKGRRIVEEGGLV